MQEEIFGTPDSRETVLTTDDIVSPGELLPGASVRAASSGLGLWLRDLLETVVLALIIFLVINTVTGRYEVQSISMEPTLHEGQYLIVSKITYWFHPPERGDVVVLDPPNGQSPIPYIKRVVGLPGEAVDVRDGRVWIDGVALNEPYISGPPTYNQKRVLGENEYLVLGDNRNNSSDSHVWGALPRQNIIGKSVFRYWPPEKWGWIPHYTFPELEAQP
ncbi:MAG: signal peptidase I [Anaerolineales bacterium]|nr:signal peptidase I [Anaerolineales bacterium]